MTYMKSEYAKLEDDNNKNMKIIENFLTEAGKNMGEFLLGKSQKGINTKNTLYSNQEQDEQGNIFILIKYFKKFLKNKKIVKIANLPTEKELNDILTQCSAMNISPNTFVRLREVYVINNLKKQISNLKKTIVDKDQEIEGFKNNIRCAKYSKLEYNYSTNLSQLIQIKKDNEILRSNCEEISMKFSEEVEENQKLFLSLSKHKTQHEEFKLKLKLFEESNNELSVKNKYLEEKVTLLNKSIIHQPVQLTRNTMKQKDYLINGLKSELDDLSEKYKNERERLEKNTFYIEKEFRKIKEALEYIFFTLKEK